MKRYGAFFSLVAFIQSAITRSYFPRLDLLVVSVFSILAIAASSIAYAVDPNTVIDFRMDSVNVEGGKKEKILVGAKWVPNVIVQEGQTVSIDCNWSANLAGAAYWQTKVNQTIQYIIKIDQGTIGFGPSVMPAGTTLGKKESKSTGLNVPSLDNPSPVNVSGTSTNYGNSFATRTDSIKWTAKGVGQHSVTCILPETGFQEMDLNNNIAEARLEVAAVPQLQSQSPGSDTNSGTAKQSDTGATVMAAQGGLSGPTAQSQKSTEQSGAPAGRMPAQNTADPVTSGQACALSVPYLKAESPVIETANSDLRQGDVFRIICRFTTDLRDLTWSNCDANTARMVEGYRGNLNRSSDARYSGMVDVNGSTVRVMASPPQGLSAFEIEHLWVQKEPGNVVIGCKVDNILQPYVEGSGRYIESQKSVNVGSPIEGRKIVGRTDLPPSGRTAGGQTSIGSSGAADPKLNPQPEVPSAKQSREAVGVSSATANLPAVQGLNGGAGAVNPALNPQPEVPSTKQREGVTGISPSATKLPAVQGPSGGSGAVNPALNPQPEVPSANQRRGVPGTSTIADQQQMNEKEELAGPSPDTRLPDKVDLQKDSGQAPVARTGNQPQPPVKMPVMPGLMYGDGSGTEAAPEKEDPQLDSGQAPLAVPGDQPQRPMLTPLPPKEVELDRDTDQSHMTESGQPIPPLELPPLNVSSP